MKVEHPNANPPTPEERESLEKLKAMIERAIADGIITPDEIAAIKAQTWADGKVSVEELNLYSSLISEKVRKGELEWHYEN